MSAGRCAAALLCLALGAARSSAAQGTGAVTGELAAQRVRQGAVAWAPDRRLAWGDFPAPVPPGEGGAARVTTGLLYATACEGSAFLFGVEAAFVPGSSWVAPRVLLDSAVSARVLTHEQTHFDLSESVARELRQALARLPEPCRELGRGVPALLEEFAAREHALQAR